MGTSNWEETAGQTQNPLEGLYISSGLGTSQDPQEEPESVAGEKEAWGALLSRLPPRPGPGREWMDGWKKERGSP